MKRPMVHHHTQDQPRSSLHVSVFVIAHPDDESMFFVPTLVHLLSQQSTLDKDKSSISSQQQLQQLQHQVWLLCLTTGDYDGLGAVRVKELQEVVTHILPVHQLLWGTLPDHPSKSWNIAEAAQCIQHVLEDALSQQKEQITQIQIWTFDESGVSGHINHRDTFRAVQHVWQQSQQQREHVSHSSNKPKLADVLSHVWILKTEHNLVTKYLPMYSWWLFLVVWVTGRTVAHPLTASVPNTTTALPDQFTVRLLQPWINWRAMATHDSQFVWYRRLFVVFSCYTYVNVWHRLANQEAHDDQRKREPPRQTDKVD